jgi:hypothetical protein
MANPLTGEVSFEAGGETYMLVLDVDAICNLETRLDMGIGEIVMSLNGSPRLGFLRAMLWAGLQAKHKGISEKAAGDLIPLMGGLPGVSMAIGKAVSNAFAAPEEGDSADPPQKEADGTGSASSPNGTSMPAKATSGSRRRAPLN